MSEENLLASVRADTEARLKEEGFRWKDSRWTQFIEEVATWLLEDKGRDPDDVTDTTMGLISYRAFTQDDLKAIADTKKEFRDTLTAEGVPKAICDALFDKYVAPAQTPIF